MARQLYQFQTGMINDVLEDTFILGREHKKNIINLLMERLNYTEEKANEIYDITSSIITNAIKNKIKHPFKTKD